MMRQNSNVRQRATMWLLACLAAVGMVAAVPTAAAAAVTPGAFCAAADEGKTGYTVTGVLMRCVTTATDSRLRWRAAFEERPQFSLQETQQFIAIHESPHGLQGNPTVYIDTTGNPTIGVGFNLNRADARTRITDVGADYDAIRSGEASLSQDQITTLFEADFATATAEVRTLVPSFDSLNSTRRAVLIDMMFNLGAPRLGQFQNMLSALSTADYANAAAEMRDSQWAQQVGNRATEDARLMENGCNCGQ